MAALAAAIAEVPARALLVGGCVRDHLMGRAVEDWDVEVHGLEVDRLERLLRRHGAVSLVGRSFGVYKLRPRGWSGPEIDVSIPRTDAKVGPGHRGIAITGDPWLGVREAARRRDLTVNAIGIDLATRAIEDPFDGRGDLARGLLRAVDRRTFLEDPLRALRVAQFAARLGFAVDPELLGLCREAALDELPAERLLGEWVKLLLADRPSAGLRVARDARILARLFPGPSEDPAVDRVVDRLVPASRRVDPPGRRLAWMLAAWLHRGDEAHAERILDRLGVHRYGGVDCRAITLALVAHHRDPSVADRDLRWLATRAEVDGVLALVAARDGVDVSERTARSAALGVARDALPPLLAGRHLAQAGVAPGPAMGELLREVYALQLEGEVGTLDEARAAAERIRARRGPGGR